MAKAKQPVLIITYKKEKEMRKDMARKIAEGYTVQASNIMEHRGGKGCLLFGLLAFMRKHREWQVTYVLLPPSPPPMPTAPPVSGSL